MKIDWSFPRQVLLALLVVGCLGAYPLMTYGSADITRSAFTGALLATLNVLIGYAAIEYSHGKSTTTFFKYVLGGMGVRMLLMALVLVLFIKVFQFHAAALISSMGIFYVVFLTLEILFIQKKVGIKHQR
ncbi:MAG: hypothetical protein HY033_10750 [Ignavibacteriae bacterium]|nr:hypothetical protein [Ignavibacteria bacterium]MBI3365377.1 hypothetical protein [Ignavibacteriota bacterium]